jgi:hypothetical protein
LIPFNYWFWLDSTTSFVDLFGLKPFNAWFRLDVIQFRFSI